MFHTLKNKMSKWSQMLVQSIDGNITKCSMRNLIILRDDAHILRLTAKNTRKCSSARDITRRSAWWRQGAGGTFMRVQVRYLGSALIWRARVATKELSMLAKFERMIHANMIVIVRRTSWKIQVHRSGYVHTRKKWATKKTWWQLAKCTKQPPLARPQTSVSGTTTLYPARNLVNVLTKAVRTELKI